MSDEIDGFIMNEGKTFFLNGVSVSDTRIGYDTYMTRICEVSNSKDFSWIFDNFSMILTQS